MVANASYFRQQFFSTKPATSAGVITNNPSGLFSSLAILLKIY
jgi:hypothetical protein